MTTHRITFHHQGAGRPNDKLHFLDQARYSIGIGQTRYEIRRSPETSFITGGAPYVRSLQVAFSGNRNLYPLTAEEIELTRQALNEARELGWIADEPPVTFHGTIHATDKCHGLEPTECPGSYVMERCGDLLVASRKIVLPPTQEDDVPNPTDVVDALATPAGSWQLTADGGVRTVRGKFYGSYPALPAEHRQGVRSFVAITERIDDPARAGYTLWANDGARYTFPSPLVPV